MYSGPHLCATEEIILLKERVKVNLPVIDINKIPWKYELKRNRHPIESPHRTIQVQLDAFWYHPDKGFTQGGGSSKTRGKFRKDMRKEAQMVAGSPFGLISEIVSLNELQDMLNEAIKSAYPDLRDPAWQLKETRYTPIATLLEEICGNIISA